MPVRKVKGGYQWGTSGKVYPTREQAEKQGAAIYAAGYKSKSKNKKKEQKYQDYNPILKTPIRGI